MEAKKNLKKFKKISLATKDDLLTLGQILTEAHGPDGFLLQRLAIKTADDATNKIWALRR
jgi:hypothetical protein